MTVRAALVALALCLPAPVTAQAEGLFFMGPAYLVDLTLGSSHTRRIREAAVDYVLADGTPAGIPALYRQHWQDLSLLMMSEVSGNLGVLWGFSAGDKGRKYRIDPSLRLGLVHSDTFGRNLSLSSRVLVRLGGSLREKPCTADYGEIGGVQSVNCRLAATELPPDATLDYLFDLPPPDRVQASIVLTWTF